ncbi:MAG: copper homeostasis periplasmic binding protein CopC [Proteobacteria bacterium]|nr:copper homeostasis periplasmic binding protein CopC [Pseudomonadota bacterium]
MRNPIIAGLGAIALLATAAAAAAHGKVLSTTPASGETGGSPAELRLVLSEAIFPKFSGIVLKDQAGHVVKTGAAGVDPTKKQLFVPLKVRLAPGAYTVEWHVVCADTHRMQGRYGFVVK